jgi:mannose-6-phosphate isomerase-like protein (cupin superfamily)
MNIVHWTRCEEYFVHGEARERSLLGPADPGRHVCPKPPGIYCTEKIAFFNRAVLPPAGALEMHVGASEEIYYILDGRGLFHVGNESAPCRKGDAIHVPAGVAHGLTNSADEPIEYLVLGAL